MTITKIISGGQTGVDRAALRWALDHGIEISGYAPRGFQAEGGPIPEQFARHMTEMPQATYPARTRANVKAADATLVLYAPLSAGSRLTIQACEEPQIRKPYLARSVGRLCAAPDDRVERERLAAEIRDWLAGHPEWRVLNVAGTRKSKAPAIFGVTYRLLDAVFGRTERTGA